MFSIVIIKLSIAKEEHPSSHKLFYTKRSYLLETFIKIKMQSMNIEAIIKMNTEIIFQYLVHSIETKSEISESIILK